MQNEIFEIRIFSNPRNFFYFDLIHFFTDEISSPENTLSPGILAHHKKSLKDVNP